MNGLVESRTHAGAYTGSEWECIAIENREKTAAHRSVAAILAQLPDKRRNSLKAGVRLSRL